MERRWSPRKKRVRQGYDLSVLRRLARDGWVRRRGLSLTTHPAVRVARGGALGGCYALARGVPVAGAASVLGVRYDSPLVRATALLALLVVLLQLPPFRDALTLIEIGVDGLVRMVRGKSAT